MRRCVAPPAAPGRAPIQQRGTGGARDQQGPVRTVRHVLQQIQHRRVRPMDVLDDHDRRAIRGHGAEEVSPGIVHLGADLSRIANGDRGARRFDADREGQGPQRAFALFRVCRRRHRSVADLLDDDIGRITVVDAGGGLEDLGERPIGDAVSVGQTPTLHDRDRVGLPRLRQELLRQAALPDAGLSVDRHEVRSLFGLRPFEGRADQIELAIAPHHRRGQAGNAPRVRSGSRPQHDDGVDRLRLALQGERRKRCPAGSRRRADRPRRRHDLSGFGGRLQARGRVDRVSSHHRLSRYHVDRRQHLARVHPDADPKLQVVDATQLLVHLPETRQHALGGAHRAAGVVLVGRRHPEHGHDGVADELLDGAALGFDLGAHRVEVGTQHVTQALGVELLSDGGRAGDVGEQNGDQLAFLSPNDSLDRLHGRAALRAVARVVRQRRATGRTGPPEGGAARDAERRVGWVVGATARTGQRGSLREKRIERAWRGCWHEPPTRVMMPVDTGDRGNRWKLRSEGKPRASRRTGGCS